MKIEKRKNIIPVNTAPREKFVKKASMWCRTSWQDGKQKQEWYDK